MRKILFLHPAHFEQSMGGAEHQISMLIAYLIENHNDLEIYQVYEDLGTPLTSQSSVRLLPLPKLKISKRLGDRWFLHRKGIQKYLDTVQPDVIYTRLYSSWSGIAAEYALKNQRVHIWALASDNDVTRLSEPFSLRKPLNMIESKWIRFAFGNASYILTQNNFQQTRLLSDFGRDGILVRQSTDEFSSAAISKPGNKLRVCWIANLKPLKQPQLFIHLAKKLKDVPGIEFVMIGRPDKRYFTLIENAKETIPNFFFRGELTNEKVNEELLNSHILVNTSEYEGFSNTFVQAWMRKSVVVSLNSDPDNLLSQGKLGFLAETFDNLCSIVAGLAEHPERIKEVGERAHSHALAYHSYQKNVRIITKLMGLNE